MHGQWHSFREENIPEKMEGKFNLDVLGIRFNHSFHRLEWLYSRQIILSLQ